VAPSVHPLVVVVLGGLDDGEPVFATAGDLRWERAPGELFAHFRARAVAAAAAAGECYVVVGGLGSPPTAAGMSSMSRCSA
jgi:hypothetical protein